MVASRPYLVAAAAIYLACAISLAASPPEASVRYHLRIDDSPEHRCFVLSLESADKRTLCIHRQGWPSVFGELHFGSTWVTLISSEGTFRARDTNFGFCEGGPSCVLMIPPGGVLIGIIGYEQFGDPERIAKLSHRRLRFPVSPFVCRFD